MMGLLAPEPVVDGDAEKVGGEGELPEGVRLEEGRRGDGEWRTASTGAEAAAWLFRIEKCGVTTNDGVLQSWISYH